MIHNNIRNTQVLLNIILFVFENMERSTLEKYDYIINDIGTYLMTNISIKHRFKQSVDNLSKIKMWALGEDKVYHKSNEIADGVDLSELKSKSEF